MEIEASTLKKVGIVAGLLIVAVIIFFVSRSPNGPVTPEANAIPDPATGSADAIMVIREYSDFQCPACRAAYPPLHDFVKKHPTEVRLESNDFPLPQHQFARLAAYAANCANAQGKFWEFADVLFEKQPEWTTAQDPLETMKGYFKALGGDETKLAQCTNDKTYKDAVEQDIKEGADLNINGTPTFFVNGERYVGGMTVEEWEAKLTSIQQSSGPRK